MSMPRVSVIVPNYNHAAFLRQRIESIQNQTFQDFELILLDDCSTDNSRELMEEYRDDPHVSHIVFNEVNSGSAFHQWDKGIALAQGEWIWIAESDDYADPVFLESLLREASNVSDCVLAYSATWWVDNQGKIMWWPKESQRVNKYHGIDFIHEKLAVCNSISNVSECLFRRQAYRPQESWRYLNMRLCGDWLFYVLLAEMGQVVEMEQPLSFYRQHESNISATAEHNGLTFIEGVEVLDYMIEHCGLRTGDYAKGWGKLWAKYEKQYKFTKEVKKRVRRHLSRHAEIVFYYRLYQLKLWRK